MSTSNEDATSQEESESQPDWREGVEKLDRDIADYQERFDLSWDAALFLVGLTSGDGGLNGVRFPREEMDYDDSMILGLIQELIGKNVVELRGNIFFRWIVPDYQEYIGSARWSDRADAAKERAGGRCQVCNSDVQLDAHHRTYERLGHERPGDLTVLCRGCHTLFHENGKLAR